jgi:hypothetical protein
MKSQSFSHVNGDWHSLRCVSGGRKETAMMKTLEAIGEAVRNPKYSFRKAEHQPRKERKHRYERRKIKEYIHLGDWLAEELA